MAQSNAATSPAAAAKRIDRRPSNLMMEDLNQNDLSVRADSAPQVASPAQVQPEMNQPIEHNNYAYNVSMSASTNEALVRKATAALEPLCGRLCRYAGQPGFDIAVDRAELEKIRNLCDTMLRLTAADDDELDEMPPEMHVGATMRTDAAINKQLPLFSNGQTRNGKYNKTSNYAKLSSPAGSPMATASGGSGSDPGSPLALAAGITATPPGSFNRRFDGNQLVDPKEFAPTRPKAPDQLQRARQARLRRSGSEVGRSASAEQVVRPPPQYVQAMPGREPMDDDSSLGDDDASFHRPNYQYRSNYPAVEGTVTAPQSPLDKFGADVNKTLKGFFGNNSKGDQ